MISTTNIEQAKKLIKTEQKPIIVKAQDDNFNRKILEYGKFEILLSPDRGNKTDNLRQIDSGLNRVLADIASRKGIAIGFDFQEIESLEKKEKAKRLSRIRQNIKISRKSKTKIKSFNYKDKKDAQALLLSLGASTQQASEAF